MFRLLLGLFWRFFHSRRDLLLENLALRQQLFSLTRRKPRPRLANLDRLFWAVAKRPWPQWKQALVVVTPETAIRWHRTGFGLYWNWLSRHRVIVGRKRISKEVRDLIFRMVAENSTWGAPRIHGELLIAALAPDADETSQTQQSNFPKTDVFSYIEVADGRIWLLPEGIDCFAGDLSEQEKKLVWATQCVPAPDLFSAKVGGTAWRSKPSWYIVAKNDRTVHPDMERFVAKRMGATTMEAASCHVAMLSHPDLVIDVIRGAAKAVQARSTAA